MTSLYEISYYWIEQHITLTLPTWHCLCTVRITWLYLTPLLFMRAVGLVVWLSLCMAYVCPGFDRHIILRGIGYFFLLLTAFCTFSSLFPIMANISIFLSHWHFHMNVYYQLSQFMRRCKACKKWWYLCIVLSGEITQNRCDRNMANFIVLLLFLEKSAR